MSDRKRLGLSLEKDGGYSKLIVFMSAVLSGFTFGLPGFLGALTVEVRFSKIFEFAGNFYVTVEKSRGTEFATSNSRYSSSLDTRFSLCGFYGGIRQVLKLMLIR